MGGREKRRIKHFQKHQKHRHQPTIWSGSGQNTVCWPQMGYYLFSCGPQAWKRFYRAENGVKSKKKRALPSFLIVHSSNFSVYVHTHSSMGTQLHCYTYECCLAAASTPLCQLGLRKRQNGPQKLKYCPFTEEIHQPPSPKHVIINWGKWIL